MFFIRPVLSLEKHLGLTSSPHFPLSASCITLLAYSKSLPLRLWCSHNRASIQTKHLLWNHLYIPDRLVAHLSILLVLSSGHTVRLVHSPAIARFFLLLVKGLFKSRGVMNNPTIEGAMLNRQTSLSHHFFNVTITKWVSTVPTNALKDDCFGCVPAFKWDHIQPVYSI